MLLFFSESCIQEKHPFLLTFSGHRRASFQASDVNELVELRARQRTFYGAYGRTALSNLGSALTILRLFEHRFYQSLSRIYNRLRSALIIMLRSRCAFRRSRNHVIHPLVPASHPLRARLCRSLGKESKIFWPQTNSNQRPRRYTYLWKAVYNGWVDRFGCCHRCRCCGGCSVHSHLTCLMAPAVSVISATDFTDLPCQLRFEFVSTHILQALY